MSHFYGTMQGSRGEATRAATKTSGLTTKAAGWQGCIRTEIYFDEATGKDHYRVLLTPWQNSGGTSRVIAEGVLDAKVGA